MGVLVVLGRPVAPPQAVNAQQLVKSFVELLVGTRVDDGVDAAVEVSEPEGDFKNGLRRTVRREHGACEDTRQQRVGEVYYILYYLIFPP